MSIEIRQHEPGKDIQDFIQAGFEVFRDDPKWIPPLDMMLKEHLSPAHDPVYEHAAVALFTARKDGRLVGRVSATEDRAWLDRWHDATGHFGYFDTIDDLEVAQALLTKAEGWLRQRGLKRVNGPMGFTATQEIGMLVDGFEHSPVLDMAHSRRYQGRLVEQCGFTKEKDLFAWRYDTSRPFSPRTIKAWESITSLPEVRLRTVQMSKLREELELIMNIYNETWSDKWGYVPTTSKEIDKLTKDMRLVLDPDIAFIAEIDGQAAGMCITIPNFYEAIADLNGKLFPFGWAKMLYRAKVRGLRSTRLILLGVREQIRKNVKRYGGLSAAMYVEIAKRGAKKGYQWAELSWTREDDAPVNLGIKSMGGNVYKTYRVYQKSLV